MIDDLGQEAKPSSTVLRYTPELICRAEEKHDKSVNPIQILQEELTHLPKKELGYSVIDKAHNCNEAQIRINPQKGPPDLIISD